MSKLITSTGWFGVPGKEASRGRVHMMAGKLPVCGARPKGQYQWCSLGANYKYTDCVLCRRHYERYEANLLKSSKPQPGQKAVRQGNKKDKWIVLNGRLYMRLLACPRCGRSHGCLLFKPLSNPEGEFTHWTLCPRNQQPILKHL